jgi:muramoyltetrapeptide carboxypeptidase LdcA involved in peptidoglycan recycling
MIKPEKLSPGDKVAAVSPSWGGPGTFPHRYEAGKRQFERAFDLTVVEMPNALREPGFLAANPKARADDLMQAFSDTSIKGVIATIGGDDSIRLLPHLDLDVIRKNPKVFSGYSDTTVSHFACLSAGLVSFYGPSFMSGFGENTGMHPYLEDSFRKLCFENKAPGSITPNTEGWTVEMLDWGTKDNQKIARKLEPCTGWNWLQGRGTFRGHLMGGCLEVLDWMRGTRVWPAPDKWKGSIVFLETSEEAPTPHTVQRILRSLAACGVFEESSGVLFGRPGGVKPAPFAEYDKAILDTLRDELGLSSLPIVTGMDFGHTDPFMTLPIGVKAEIDCEKRQFSITEAAVR